MTPAFKINLRLQKIVCVERASECVRENGGGERCAWIYRTHKRKYVFYGRERVSSSVQVGVNLRATCSQLLSEEV